VDHCLEVMKRISRTARTGRRHGRFFSILSILLIATAAFATGQSVTLAWDANREPDVAGYVLHFGTSSLTLTNTINVGNITSKTISGLVSGVTYFFAVTAYNTSGLESSDSNEGSYNP